MVGTELGNVGIGMWKQMQCQFRSLFLVLKLFNHVKSGFESFSKGLPKANLGTEMLTNGSSMKTSSFPRLV